MKGVWDEEGEDTAPEEEIRRYTEELNNIKRRYNNLKEMSAIPTFPKERNKTPLTTQSNQTTFSMEEDFINYLPKSS